MYVEIARLGEKIARGDYVPFQERSRFYRQPEVHRSLEVYNQVPLLVDLWVDVDKPDEKTVEELKNRLKEFPGEVEVWWSGGGYHLNIQDVWNFDYDDLLSGTVAKAVLEIFPMADIQRYRPRSLIRLENTYNQRRGLWKVRLPELLDPPDARKLASREPDPIPSAVFEKKSVLPKPIVEQREERELTGLSIRRPFWPRCVANIWNRGPQRGSRHNDCLILAQFFRRWNFTEDEVYTLLSYWLKPDPLPEKELENIIRRTFVRGYQFGCSSPELQGYCELPCAFRAFKNTEGNLYRYASVLARNAIDIGKPFGKPGRAVVPGELVTLIGSPGSFKSLICQWLTVVLDVPALFLSLDMQPELAMRRYLQIAYNKTKEEVLSAVLEYRVSEDDCPVPVAAPDLHLDTIRNTFSALVSEYRPLIVVVDHIGMIYGDMNYGELMAERSRVLSKLARELEIVVIAIDHTSRTALREGTVGMTAGRNALTEAESSIVISATKQDEDSSGYSYVLVKTEKTRDTAPFEVIMKVDPIRMKVKPILRSN